MLVLGGRKSFGHHFFALYLYIGPFIQGAKQTQSVFLLPCWYSIASACVLQKEYR